MVSKARIRLSSTNPQDINSICGEIREIADKTGVKLKGPIPLPTKRSLYTVLRSPHVDKKSREQFETRSHKRLIDILNSTNKTVDSLMKLELPAGVDVEIKV